MQQQAEQPQRLVDEAWDDGPRYTEERAAPKRSFPVRRCALWAGEQEVLASTLELLSLTLRFGAVALPVEGYAGVSTAPDQRRRGYMKRLFPRSMRSATERVSVACRYGIADFYPRFGFVACLHETEYRVRLSAARRLEPVAEGALRTGSLADLPAMRALFNQVHGERPWSVARAAHWDAIPRSREWRPGADISVAGSGGTLIPDDGDLLRLVFGYERFDRVPEERRGAGPKLWEVAAAWFPGGGTSVLAEPFAHELHRY